MRLCDIMPLISQYVHTEWNYVFIFIDKDSNMSYNFITCFVFNYTIHIGIRNLSLKTHHLKNTNPLPKTI